MIFVAHPFKEYVNPYLGQLLEQIKLDKKFVRGEGCYLYDDQGRRYLDFIAAYGALPFGYNPSPIWQAIERVHHNLEPSFIQPSFLNAAGELARRLVEITCPGLRYVTFTNSGAETVEAAIKLCRSATGRMGILATTNSFHGKTLGALSATGRSSYQRAFGAPVEGFEFVPYGNLDALEEAFQKHASRRQEQFAAFIVEPIQGEGGIVVPPAGYLKGVRELCDRYGVFLVLDEIQTGLGRTGRLFAYEEEGICPDVLLLAKALGGGIVPIGACIAGENVYNEEFATKHSSTFAANSLACRVGLAVIEWLTADEQRLVRQVAQRGAQLLAGLKRLQQQYSQILVGVRGRGLMLGIEFTCHRQAFPNGLLGVMAEQELLAPAAASYLLNVTGLRVAPTLNGNRVLRIEPPLVISEQECQLGLAAIEEMLSALATYDTARFLHHLVGSTSPAPVGSEPKSWGGNSQSNRTAQASDPQTCQPQVTRGSKPELGASRAYDRPNWPQPQAKVTSLAPALAVQASALPGRFAFLVHPVAWQNYVDFDPSLKAFNEDELRELAFSWNDLVDPFVIGSTEIVSAAGAKALGEFIVVPRTAEELLAAPRSSSIQLIRQAVDLGRARGASIVGLGAYTSVVSGGGLFVRGRGVAITSGNSYTVVAAAEVALTALEKIGLPPAEASVAVVGATGSIGRGVALLLAEKVGRLILVGNPDRPEHSLKRLAKIAEEIEREAKNGPRRPSAASGTVIDCLGRQGILSPAGMAGSGGRAGTALTKDQPRRQREDIHPDGKSGGQPSAVARSPLEISIAFDKALPEADLVITATNSPRELLLPDHLKAGAIICDMSRPANVSPELSAMRPDVLVIDGGVIAIPGAPYLGWDFELKRGLAYACMAETMMLALEQRFQDTSIGPTLTWDDIHLLERLAAKHGFRVGPLHSFGQLITEERWAHQASFRQKQKQWSAG